MKYLWRIVELLARALGLWSLENRAKAHRYGCCIVFIDEEEGSDGT